VNNENEQFENRLHTLLAWAMSAGRGRKHMKQYFAGGLKKQRRRVIVVVFVLSWTAFERNRTDDRFRNVYRNYAHVAPKKKEERTGAGEERKVRRNYGDGRWGGRFRGV